MMTMMASLVEWRSNSSLFPSVLLDISWFFLSWFPPPLPFFYPPLTIVLLFSYPHMPRTAATQSAGAGSSFLHDDVRTSAISCFLLLNGCVFGTLHHITSPFGFLFTWTLGFTWEVHISYTIYPIWTWGGIGLESIFQQFVQVHHITPYYIILCLSFLPLLSLCLCHFVRCVGMRRGCFHLGLYHYLCIICYYFSFCAFFITLMPDIGQRFLSSFFAFFGIHIYIQPVCWGGGLCIRHVLSSCLGRVCILWLDGYTMKILHFTVWP